MLQLGHVLSQRVGACAARAKQAHTVHQHMKVGRGEGVFERRPLTFQPTIACVHLPHTRLGTQRGAAHPLTPASARDRILILGQMRRGKWQSG